MKKSLSFSLISLIAGLILPLAFAPVGAYPLAFVCLGAWLWALRDATPSMALWRGWLFGLGFFGVGVSWVFVSLHGFGGANLAFAGLGTAVFVTVLALFPAVQSYVLVKLWPNANRLRHLIAAPALMIIFDGLRANCFSGLPWLLIGNSQTNAAYAHVMAFTGSLGFAGIVTLVAGLFIEFKSHKLMSSLVLVTLTGLLFFINAQQWTTPLTHSLNIIAVQGNIPLAKKWDVNFLQDNLSIYQKLSESAPQHSVIIWPEAAIPIAQTAITDYLQELDVASFAKHNTLITGIPIIDHEQFYNGLLMLGRHHGEYRKRHLVPFGEYFPFHGLIKPLLNWFDIPMSDYTSGHQAQANLEINNINIGPLICYEIAFDELLRSQLPQANAFIVLSDDAWFGHSFAPWQQLQITQARAIETARPIIAVANSGITALVNYKGRITAQLKPFSRNTLSLTLRPRSGETPWTRWGDWPALLLALIALGLAKLLNRVITGSDNPSFNA